MLIYLTTEEEAPKGHAGANAPDVAAGKELTGTTGAEEFLATSTDFQEDGGDDSLKPASHYVRLALLALGYDGMQSPLGDPALGDTRLARQGLLPTSEDSYSNGSIGKPS